MVLESTPYGTSIDEVRNVAATLVDETCELGVFESKLSRSPAAVSPLGAQNVLTGCLGTGRGMLIFRAYTFAHWYFDDKGALVHVEVIRATDAL